MIGNHLQRTGFEILRAGNSGGGGDQGLEQIDLVIAVHALQNGRSPLQPHAGVHRRPGQRGQLSGFVAVVLHEHQIPDFDEAIAFVGAHARRASVHARPVVVEDFRTGSAGAGVPHRPEIAAVAQANDARIVQTRHLLPVSRGLVIVLVNRDQQPLLGQFQFAGHETPGQANRFVLEVVAEAEISQHFEEGMVPGRVAHVLQVVVLAPRPQATLHGNGAGMRGRLPAEEDVLELHHSGVGEQQRGIVMRNQRRAGQMPVAPPLEILHKRAADFRGFHGAASLSTARATCPSENPRPRRNLAWRAIPALSGGGAAPKRRSRAAVAH